MPHRDLAWPPSWVASAPNPLAADLAEAATAARVDGFCTATDGMRGQA